MAYDVGPQLYSAYVTKPTRVMSSSATLFDHIITNQATRVDQCGVVDA